ncbi:MAG TPA: DNA polymerase, partial [bacterium]|nr:DNA polymerase [bacterium]
LLSELEFTSELKELLTTKKNININSDIKVNVLDQRYVEHEGSLLGHDLLHNCDIKTLSSYEKIFDTRIASYVLNPGERDYPLEDISLKTIKESFDPKLFPAIKEVLNEQIKEKGLERVFYEIDIPCIKPLKEMEETGVMVDVDKLKELSSEFGTLISEYTEKIYKEAGMEFNINSPKQLSFVLFEKLNLISLMAKKTDTGLSTDQEVLQELSNSHPLPKLVIEYRELAKLKGTYIDPLIEMAQNNDSRIRTTYNLDLTSTGRLSSSNPNLQNIPIRTPSGARIRETFIAPKGKKLISADYSQVELRIFAYLSKDEKMLDAFKKGDDIHTRTASEIFDVPIELVTLSQRAQAKAVNFGIIYGKTPYGLARELNIPQSVASKIISRYFERYSGVANVREELIKKARANGYSETIFGRRRYLPDINTKHVARRNFAERNAINAPIQGSASDIMKLALSKVWEKLKNSHPDSKIIMHVHDELVVEAPEKDVTKIAELLKYEMENVVDFTPRLTVQTSVGQNWLEAH